MKRKIYLNMQTLEEARRLLFDRFGESETEEELLDARDALGRVTTQPVTAALSSPRFHSAAMDGFAVVAEDTFGATDETPVTLDIGSDQAVPINTGFPMPEDKNAVVMVEHILLSDDGQHGIIRSAVYPWQNVRKVGEDIVATELLFPAHHILGSADLAALLTGGRATVAVQKKPRLVIMPTGTELVFLEKDNQQIPAGKTIESNSAVLAAMAVESGAEVDISPVVQDSYKTLKASIQEAAFSDADIVVINAGSSAGSADYTLPIIEELGEVLVHGVTIMPGKPTILGVINDKPVIGNPGFPVSAIISFKQFVVPLLYSFQGIEEPKIETITAISAKNLPSRSGMEEFRRMITGKIGERYVTVPMRKGAGAITTLTRANSILRIPMGREGVNKNDKVKVEPLRSVSQLKKTILCTGSHDLCLDLIHNELKKQAVSYPLASTHVGSLGGIMAIKEGTTHIAGSHLLDPDSGEYNTVAVNRYITDREISLITLAHRQQGLMVLPGNPKNILSIGDLAGGDISFVNRQAGSGTRVLFDYRLEQDELDPDTIIGYDNEEYTHMAVAVSVLSEKSDAGLGILGAARALKLDFVPIVEERYDLIIPTEFLELDMIRQLLNILNSNDFKKQVETIGGYSTRETGKQVTLSKENNPDTRQ